MLKKLSFFLLLGGLVAVVQPHTTQAGSPLEWPEKLPPPAEAVMVPGGSIAISKIDGLVADGQIKAGQKITFHFTYTNKTGTPVAGFSNGFRIYSPDGAKWTNTVADTTGQLTRDLMDGGLFFIGFSVTGTGADTIGFGGFRIMKEGIPDGWSGEAFSLTIGPIDPSMTGKKICLDQSFFPPGGEWLWSLDEQLNNRPDWAGPFCFTIVK